MNSNFHLESKLREYCDKGILISRTENNQFLKVSYKGAGGLVSPKWSVKIYTSGSVVCNDNMILQDICNGTLKEADQEKILVQADDAGWGFPLLGVMVGICCQGKIEINTVDVSYFQGNKYEHKKYLGEYARLGYDIVTQIFKAKPETHRIEICTGYVNRRLKSLLREHGYDVRVVEITGLLQDSLEDLFKQYVHKTLGMDLAYDPKEIGNNKIIANKYYEVLRWGKRYAPHLLKTGWNSIK